MGKNKKSFSSTTDVEEILKLLKSQYKRDISDKTKNMVKKRLSYLESKGIEINAKYHEVYGNAWTLVYIQVGGILLFRNDKDKRLNSELFADLQISLFCN